MERLTSYEHEVEQVAATVAERRLWLAVLTRAILDATRGSYTSKASAIEWLTSTRFRTGSFAWVVQILGLESDALRNEIVSRIEAGTIGDKRDLLIVKVVKHKKKKRKTCLIRS